MASQFQSEFELHARAILGLPVNTARHSVAASAVIYAGVDANNLSFSHLNTALAHPDTDLRLLVSLKALSVVVWVLLPRVLKIPIRRVSLLLKQPALFKFKQIHQFKVGLFL